MGLFKKKPQEEIKANPEPIEPFETVAPQTQQQTTPSFEDYVMSGITAIFNNENKILELTVENKVIMTELIKAITK